MMSKKFSQLQEQETSDESLHIEQIIIQGGSKRFLCVSKFLFVGSLLFILCLLGALFIAPSYMTSSAPKSGSDIEYKMIIEPKVAYEDKLSNTRGRDMQEGWVYTSRNSPLRKICDQTKWKKNVFIKTLVVKGLVNVRNELMSFIRWAIDAGVHIVTPEISIRASNPNRWHVRSNHKNISFFFDNDYLMKSLKENCPQLIIKDEKEVAPKYLLSSPAKAFTHYSAGGFKAHVDGLLTESKWDSSQENTMILFNRSIWGWDFTNEFEINQLLFNMVQFNPKFVGIADELMDKLSAQYVGFHLRAESDQHWYKYEDLVAWFQEGLESQNITYKTIFLAIGDKEVETNFTRDMKAKGYKVVSKSTLAADDEQLTRSLTDLTFDQAAVVDYEVLKRSTYFFGVGRSSFSYGIGYQRGNGTLDKCDCQLEGKIDSFFEFAY